MSDAANLASCGSEITMPGLLIGTSDWHSQ
jgi:hypothetical protein